MLQISYLVAKANKAYGTVKIKKSSDFLTFIPPKLADPFSTQELAEGTNQPRWLAQKMAYCLRKMGAIEVVGKTGNSILYSTANTSASQLT